MEKGTVVRVKFLADLPSDQLHFRGMTGKVSIDSEPGCAVFVAFKDPDVCEQFHPDVLDIL
jgi:hypothetical protein